MRSPIFFLATLSFFSPAVASAQVPEVRQAEAAALVRQAIQACEENKVQHCAQLLSRALGHDAELDEARLYLAVLFLSSPERENAWPMAERLLQAILTRKPDELRARLHLGILYAEQFISREPAPENVGWAEKATAEFEEVLRRDPNHPGALYGMGVISFNRAASPFDPGAFQRSVDYFERCAVLRPEAASILYWIGATSWFSAYLANQELRAKWEARTGKPLQIPAPLPEPLRREFAETYGERVATGIARMEQALRLRVDNADVMAYLNLLLRLKAELAESAEQREKFLAQADHWVEQARKSLHRETELRQETRIPWDSGPLRSKSPRLVALANLEEPLPALMFFSPPPPPPPPPPAPAHEPVQRIPVRGEAQQAKLIYAPQPVYPPLAKAARVSGTVRLQVVIGTDGTIQELQVLSGHPLLVKAAVDTVRQWRYQPTLLDAVPVEVLTTIDVVFSLGRPF